MQVNGNGSHYGGKGREVEGRKDFGEILAEYKASSAKFSPAARGGQLVQAAGRHGEMIPSVGPWF